MRVGDRRKDGDSNRFHLAICQAVFRGFGFESGCFVDGDRIGIGSPCFTIVQRIGNNRIFGSAGKAE